MGKLEVNIVRDVAKNPSIVTINRDGRIVKVQYDGDNLIFTGDRTQFPSVAEVLQIAYPYELESQSRPFWYDRNPRNVVVDYHQNNVAPHTTTQFEYTVPQNRKAMIEVMHASISRYTVAAPAGITMATYYLTPHGDANTTFFRVLMPGANNIGDTVNSTVGQSILLNPGDRVWCVTSDNSTGGACHYACSMKITEFDA